MGEHEQQALANGGREVEYVVQVQEAATDDGVGETGLWRDVATIAVPARTKRRTVVQKAAEAVQGESAPGVPQLVRVLGPEDAVPFRVSMVQPAPQLVVEGIDAG